MSNKEITNLDLVQVGSVADRGRILYAREFVNTIYHIHTTDTIRSEMNINEVLKNIAGEFKIIDDATDGRYNRTITFKSDNYICQLINYPTEGYRFKISSNSFEAAKSLEKELIKVLPIAKPEDGKIPMVFWTLNKRGGAMSRYRKIDVPEWVDIKNNYPDEIEQDIDKLMQLKPGKSGQLILFHGPPGTGKSYAIRSLIREWKTWCSPNYVIDPENFFGASAEYMISVMLGMDEGPDVVVDDVDEELPWQLYIVEDGDEFLTDDAKSRSGQALSRLLNVVDGMIGQGLRILVLVTTNEPLDKLHPAVVRPGRCLANVPFRKFSEAEGREWMEMKADEEKAAEVKGEITLAELYHKLGIVESLQPEEKERMIGFAPRQSGNGLARGPAVRHINQKNYERR